MDKSPFSVRRELEKVAENQENKAWENSNKIKAS